MLIKRNILDRIAAGEIDRAFRRWKRPTVKAGGTLRTAVGELAIEDVSQVDTDELTDVDAMRAGFSSLEALEADLAMRPNGTLYRIKLRYAGPDQRDALREDADFTDEECGAIASQLAKIDQSTGRNGLTATILSLVDRWPERRAKELADAIGMEKETFKAQVRKLKNKGLTQSLGTGYRISPRGRRVLRFLQKQSQIR